MWTICDTVQPMEAALRNSNEIICKHRKLRLQVPASGKVFRESGPSICLQDKGHNYCTHSQIYFYTENWEEDDTSFNSYL